MACSAFSSGSSCLRRLIQSEPAIAEICMLKSINVHPDPLQFHCLGPQKIDYGIVWMYDKFVTVNDSVQEILDSLLSGEEDCIKEVGA